MEMTKNINGIDVDALGQLVERVEKDPAQGMVGFGVTTQWAGGTRSVARVSSWRMAGKSMDKDFQIVIDEPQELLGENTAPNPQEMLMAALNACMTVGYVAGCAGEGIALESLEIKTEGELDLRGFLGLDEAVKPGNDTIRYTVCIKGDGTPEQFQAIHEQVIKTSPNRFNVANPVRLEAQLQIG